MELQLNKTGDIFDLELKNSLNETIELNASSSIGGKDQGFRPMELLAGSLAGCSSIDILNILNKQKIRPDSFDVTINATRKDEVPAIFERIHLEFFVSEEVPREKLVRAIELSMEKYCSVTKILEPTCIITYSIG
ncbi:MAG: OsmC family protein [Crocinitomicaceae bacterium]|nr:OsmC family protein [Crocinitomicaceae bacterium]